LFLWLSVNTLSQSAIYVENMFYLLIKLLILMFLLHIFILWLFSFWKVFKSFARQLCRWLKDK